ncbi:hypothetical protein [Priestia flexa]|uniref:hypothetical protein n=1 Tax=Priestia flexa TaxID=86664 RepID=UPI000A886EEE|nr:hypothetical protein [Priestia flexa]
MGLELVAAIKIATLLGMGLSASTAMEWFNTFKKKSNKREEAGHDEIKSLIEKSKSTR